MKDILEGKTALLTGAANGIAEETAYTFAEYGATKLSLIDMNEERLAVVRNNLKEKAPQVEVLTFVADVTNEQEAANIVKTTAEKFGRLDVAANIAGISKSAPFLDMTTDMWRETLSINLDAVMIYCREEFRQMKDQEGGGRILNISSLGALVGGIFAGGHYVTSKGGIISLTKHIAIQGAKYNILCNCVAPGSIATEMMANYVKESGEDHSFIPLKRKGTAREVADVLAFLGSDMASYITGECININGGAYMQ